MFDRKHNEGKRAFRKWKWLPAACALALALTVTVGGTLAWLATHTDPVTNTFEMGQVTPVVTEDFEQNTDVKKDVSVRNNGNVPAYIRVALVATWENGSGDVKPADLDKLDIDWGPEGGSESAGEPGNGWIKLGDYYYYQAPVAGQDFTNNLIAEATVRTDSEQPEGYHMNLQVIADSIQAAPAEAVTTTWGVTLDNAGNINGLTNAG